MTRRVKGIVLCLLLCLFMPSAFASEGEETEVFVSPTRDPNAPEYFTARPQELVAEQLVARSFYLTEIDSDTSLFEREPDLRLFPASTTKILTALIALQMNPDLDEKLVVSENAANMPEDASVVPFRQDEEVTMRDALYGLLLRSGNDAAVAIAEKLAGDVGTFVEWMNETAQMLGCVNTHYTNPHGYHDELHQTTSRDLAIMMRAALQNETFREIISTQSYELSVTNKHPARMIYNSNLHIDPSNDYYYQYSIGGKTGFTSQAGYVLVEAAAKDGVELIAVAMYSGQYSRWPDTSRLFQYGFTQYKSVTAEQIYEQNPTTVQITGFTTEDTQLGELRLNIVPKDPSRTVRFVNLAAEIDMIVENYNEYTNIRYDVELRAPITQGQQIGVLTFYPPDEEPAEYDLVASRSIAARTDAPPTLEEIEQRVQEDPSPFPPFGLDWVLPPVLGAGAAVLVVRFGVRRLRKAFKKRKQIPKPKSRTYT